MAAQKYIVKKEKSSPTFLHVLHTQQTSTHNYNQTTKSDKRVGMVDIMLKQRCVKSCADDTNDLLMWCAVGLSWSVHI